MSGKANIKWLFEKCKGDPANNMVNLVKELIKTYYIRSRRRKINSLFSISNIYLFLLVEDNDNYISHNINLFLT